MLKISMAKANLQKNKITPQYRWNPDLSGGRYIDERGRAVAQATVKSATLQYTKAKKEEVAQLAKRLQNGEINIAEWQEEMHQLIAAIHMSEAAAAKGGWAQMTAKDRGIAAQLIKQELGGLEEWKNKEGKKGGLRQFALDIQEGLDISGEGFIARAKMYALAGNHTFEVIRLYEDLAAGKTEERSIRHKDDSCIECIALANEGWQKAGTIPLPLDRICTRYCGCTMERR